MAFRKIKQAVSFLVFSLACSCHGDRVGREKEGECVVEKGLRMSHFLFLVPYPTCLLISLLALVRVRKG